MSDRDLEVKDLGAAANRARLAELLKRRADQAASVHPLSHGQQALWFMHQLVPGNAAYNVVFSARVRSPLDLAALGRALRALVIRHSVLRVTFESRDGRPVQRLHAAGDVPVGQVDASGWSTERLQSALREAARRPFDLETGPVLRVSVFTRAADDRVLLLVVHHLVVDGWSLGILLDDLFQLYAAEVAGASALSMLPTASPAQYFDHVRWQGEMLASPDGARLKAYWEDVLRGELPVLDLPTDRPRPAVVQLRGDSVSFSLDVGLTAGIKQLASSERTTPFVVLLTALQAMLSRYTGQTDILVGSPVAGRGRPAFERVVGNFMNMVVLRGDLTGDPSFRTFVSRLRVRVLEALAHQDYPFLLLLDGLKGDRDLSRMPIFQVTFNYFRVLADAARAGALLAPDPAGVGLEAGGLRLEAWPVPQQEGQFDLALEMTEIGDRFRGRFKYDSALFERATVTRMVGHFETLLRSAVEAPDRLVGELPLLSEREGQSERRVRAIHSVWPFTEFPPPSCAGSLVDRFRAVVDEHGQRVAIKGPNGSWTYGQLDRASRGVASAIREVTGSRGGRVGLLLEHDAPMVAAVVGVLRSGNAYVPLDPLYPRERLIFMLEDSEASVLVTNTRNLKLARALTGGSLRLLNIDDLAPTVVEAVEPPVAPDAMAYILYTSGSTGQPKGVVQNHRNMLHHIGVYTNNLRISPQDRLTLLASFSFDAAVMDLFGALLNGATLCLLDVREAGIDRLGEWLEMERVTIYHSTPTLYRALLLGLPEDRTFPDVRLVVLGGEEVVRRDVELYHRHFSAECFFVNGLGPTESTVSFQYVLDQSTPLAGSSVPVGYAVSDTELVLLDASGQPTTLRGEIGIRSAHVALGYWRRPELTATAFLPDPDGGVRRIYRTGDLGRLRPDGSLEFLGRRDDQVKVRGFRIEPAEVEAAIDSHPGVRRSVVVARDDNGSGRCLAAYVIPSAKPGPTTSEIVAYLRERLPSYMIPSVFVSLEAIPLTPSGKVDRRALPTPGRSDRAHGGTFVAPRTPTEELIAGIWSELLGVEAIGVEDNFFELGGHSLVAARVVSRLRTALGIDLPLLWLFETPTVAGLADRVTTKRYLSEFPKWNCLVPVQPRGTRTPLFLVVGHNSQDETMLVLSRLISPLGLEQPIYGCRPRWLDGSSSPYQSVQEMARECLDEMRTIQPRGPYLLGGYCSDCSMALEIARLLVQQGEDIKLLAMIDGGRPCALRLFLLRMSHAVNYVRNRVKHMMDVIGKIMRSDRSARKELVRQVIRRRFGSGAPTRFEGPENAHMEELRRGHVRLLLDHRAEPYQGDMTLIVSEEYYRFNKYMGWEDIVKGSVTFHQLPGDHEMLLTQHSTAVAELLRNGMADATPGSGSA